MVNMGLYLVHSLQKGVVMSDRPYVSFAEVKGKVTIPDALEALGLAEKFTRKGDKLSGVCPLPQHNHGPKPNSEQFKADVKDGVWVWHCFGDCQRGGDVIELVKAITGYDNAHVRFWFAEKFGQRLTLTKRKANRDSGAEPPENDTAREAPREDTPRTASLATVNLPEKAGPLKPLGFRLNLDANVPYLHQRGITPETIQHYGLGLCTRGVLKGYVAIPVYRWPAEPGENPVAYLGRWPGEDYDEPAGRPRYKWPDGFPKSRVVYGLSQALEAAHDQPLAVVEGPFKVYHLVQAGIPCAAAILGSSLSDEQATILIETGRRIVLMFDGDQAGQSGMRTAAAKLITRTFVRVAKLPDGTHPDQLGPEELQKMFS
jgi:DNA primase